MTLAERYIDEGEAAGMAKDMAKGITQGKTELADQTQKLYEQGVEPEEIIRMIINNANKPPNEVPRQ